MHILYFMLDSLWALLCGRVIGSTPLLHEDAADIRSPFAIAYAPPATVKVKDGNKTITVPCPAFCDIIKFKYEAPEPGGPAVRK